jgi:HEAT repeat protein
MRKLAIVSIVFVVACADYAKPSVGLYESGDFAGAARAADEGLAAHPDDGALWAMRVRSALALGDAAGVAKAYASYASERHGDDLELVRGLALATLGQAMASPSAKLKVAAIETIEHLELQPLADAVTRALTDGDDRVAAAASIALLHSDIRAPQIADAMLKSEDPEARRIAVAGVARKAGAIADAVIEEAAGDPDPRVRRAACSALGTLGDTNALGTLTQHLRDPDEGVRAAAAGARAPHRPAAHAPLAKQALADAALAVRVAGVDLLGAAGQREALVALTSDADPVVALQAVIAIEQLGAPVHERHGKRVREHVAPHTGLGAAVVQRALASPRWEVRAGAANLLDQVVDKASAVTFAHTLARDPDARVALAAARVLMRDGALDEGAGVIRAQLAGEQATQAAADIAARFGDPNALSILGGLAIDPKRTAEQRVAAIDAHRTARHITGGLVAALADASGGVRVEAASVIAELAKE